MGNGLPSFNGELEEGEEFNNDEYEQKLKDEIIKRTSQIRLLFQLRKPIVKNILAKRNQMAKWRNRCGSRSQ